MSVIQECMQDNDNILQVENICKYNKAGSGRLFDKTVFKAVNQVSFSVKRGETFGLVGESGCGKSTLAKLVMKLLEASGGRVLFDGKDITKMPKRQLDAIRKDMQIVFQDPYDSLNPRFNLKQIVSEPMENFGYSRQEIDARVKELFQEVALP